MCADLSRTQRNLLVCERSSFLDEKNRVSSQMEQLRFNYKVSVLLPEYDSAPSHLESILNSFSSFYLIKQLPLYELLDKDFLQSAVYQGSVYGLSFRTRIDEDNCVALMPNGHLVFSLDKDAFETLGLEGRPSRSNRTSSRYEVTVDLRDGSMAPGGRSYLRLRRALMSHLKLQMDFLISHHPGGGASLRPLLSRCDWLERRPEVSRRGLSRLVRPALRSCDPHDLLEWIGAVDAAVSLENSSSDFLSTLTCLEPEATVSRAMSMSACGLLLPQDLQHLVEELRCYLQQAQTDSWASVTVHGFTDSPVSWGDGGRDILTGGHDLYNLLMFPDHTYRLHLATGAQKTCPP
ncbi:ribonuclease P protein subunit p40 [Poecilia formosa]|uniref:ribonuclease P protein subunit p40 n=1 Tax=Poecilia formosa TaxID=48698 RepID=UPI000443BB07|nr:PREDICTED: ribonuclease P protein subunit p40 [Poecilia formosa]XP_016521030.1 PREDICTED: ribonuclease P protein subunit p40 [Poecilia formosa]